jgi:hypothetical protein
MKDLKLTNRLFEICIGVLLGDASIQKNKSKSNEKYRLKFLQGVKHKQYIYHLHSEFKDYVLSPPYFDKKRNTFCFQTVFHFNFKKLADIFLNKELKKNINTFFTEKKIENVSLAYWFMDDGGLLSYNKDYVRKGLVFNTQGFVFNEVLILSQNLNTAYDLNTWVKTNKKKPIIAVSGKEYLKIKNIIFPHIVDSMKYKLPA